MQVLVCQCTHGEALDDKGGDRLGWVVQHDDHLEDFVDAFVEVCISVEDEGAGGEILLLVHSILQCKGIEQVSD
mgnify:CR=1 FL=1